MTKSPAEGLFVRSIGSHPAQLVPPVLPQASATLGATLSASCVAGTAASETVANAAAASFFVFDIRVTSLRFEPLRTRLERPGGHSRRTRAAPTSG